jgi:hypothetical protein
MWVAPVVKMSVCGVSVSLAQVKVFGLLKLDFFGSVLWGRNEGAGVVCPRFCWRRICVHFGGRMMEDEGYEKCLECGEDVEFGGGHRNVEGWPEDVGLSS